MSRRPVSVDGVLVEDGALGDITGGLRSVVKAGRWWLGGSGLMEERFRLRKSDQFRLVRSEGRSWAHPLLVLYARPNQTEQTRVGFSVGKRVGKAIARNRVKRLLREAVRLRLSAIAPGWDLVFIARASIAGAPFAQVSAAVEQLLQRSGLLSSPPAHDRASRRASAAPEERASPPRDQGEGMA